MRRWNWTEEGITLPLLRPRSDDAGQGYHHDQISWLTGPGTLRLSIGNGLLTFVIWPDILRTGRAWYSGHVGLINEQVT